ncbi:MAG: hypothetical protein A3G87_04075 [Omnitrophica bacterium RIFCSPLOWO2_12_FULL_50_11]|nr:MAG: hypothetical protein A3G87_04075 [Omnitrophica bacterium RIFCSPLOWO2_12_FULL_50_11]
MTNQILAVNPPLKTDDFYPIIFDAVLVTARLLPLGGILWMSPWLFPANHDERLAKGFPACRQASRGNASFYYLLYFL